MAIVEQREVKPDEAGSTASVPGQDEISLRPEFSRYRKFAIQSKALAVAWLLVALGWTVRAFLAGLSEGWLVVGGGLLIAGFFGLYLAMYFRNARIFGTEEYFGRVGAFGRKRVWPRGKLKRVLICDLDTGYGPRRRCFFISDDGLLLGDVLADTIDINQAKVLAHRLGATFSERPDVLTREKFRTEFPNALPWIVRHPLITGMAVSFAAIALIVLSVAVLARH